MLGYPNKYCNYTSKKKLGGFPHSPPVDNFLNVYLTKNVIEHKIYRIRFWNGLYTGLISVFMNNKRAIYKFWIFEFSIFVISDIGLLWSKMTIFIIEISLKLHLHTKYGWNNPNSGRLGLKSPKFKFLPFLAVQKFIAYANIQIHVCIWIFFFL